MQVIQLDASSWATPVDFLKSLQHALGSCEGHGFSPDAFVDSMIWGGMNKVEPPYIVQVVNVRKAPADVADYVALMSTILRQARDEYRFRKGKDVEVSLIAREISN